jgi:DNA-binding transcriptional LysR family regulator
METDHLKTLLEVARRGSLAAAARALGSDPSSVSRNVAAAEARLGIRVFERSTRRLSVTAAGQAYLDRIAPLLDGLEQAAEEARAARAAPAGLVRLTASVAFGQECLIPLLPALRAELPEIELDLVLTDANLDLVREGIGLAIRLAPAPKGDLVSTRLMRTRYHLCASPAYLKGRDRPGTPGGLAAHDCLQMPLARFRDSWQFRHRSGREEDVAVTGTLTISSPLALREAARLGLGAAVLADWLVHRDLADGRLVELMPDWQPMPSGTGIGAWALYPSRTHFPRRMRAVLDFLKANIGQGPGLSGGAAHAPAVMPGSPAASQSSDRRR